MGRDFSILIVAILALSTLIMVGAVSAQSIHMPTIPEFTAKLTGSSLEVTINNQQLTDSQKINDEPHLYCGFRFKDPNSMFGGWEYAPIYFVGTSSYGTYYEASTRDYTVISFPVVDYPFDGINHHTGISKNGPVEIQVMALIGIEIPTTEQNGTVYQFDGETSDWSPTQTVRISDELVSPSPSVPEFPYMLVIPLLLSVLAIALIVKIKKLQIAE